MNGRRALEQSARGRGSFRQCHGSTPRTGCLFFSRCFRAFEGEHLPLQPSMRGFLASSDWSLDADLTKPPSVEDNDSHFERAFLDGLATFRKAL